jgi:hypothetical protein
MDNAKIIRSRGKFMSNIEIDFYEKYESISEVRLYSHGGKYLNTREKIDHHFKILLKNDSRKVSNKYYFFCDNRNKLKKVNKRRRLVLFSFKGDVYADAIMYDDGNRPSRKCQDKNGIQEIYPYSYLLECKSVRFFSKEISLKKIREIWHEAKGQQSARILGKDKSNQKKRESIKEYLQMTEGYLTIES